MNRPARGATLSGVPSCRLALPLPRSALRSKRTLIGLQAPSAHCPPPRRRAPSISNTLAGMRPPDARLLALVAPERPLVQVDVELPVEVAEKPPERPSARAQTLPSAKAATRFDWRAATLIAAVLFGTGALAAVAFRHAVRIQPTSPEAVVGALAQNAPVVLPGVDREVDLLVHGRVAPAADIDRAAAVSVVEAIARDKAEACGFASGPAFARVVVTFAPSGRAKGAAIVGGLGNTREGRCLARALLAARVPDFVGQSTSVPVTVRLR